MDDSVQDLHSFLDVSLRHDSYLLNSGKFALINETDLFNVTFLTVHVLCNCNNWLKLSCRKIRAIKFKLICVVYQIGLMVLYEVTVKWGKEKFPKVEVDTSELPEIFRAQLFALTKYVIISL